MPSLPAPIRPVQCQPLPGPYQQIRAAVTIGVDQSHPGGAGIHFARKMARNVFRLRLRGCRTVDGFVNFGIGVPVHILRNGCTLLLYFDFLENLQFAFGVSLPSGGPIGIEELKMRTRKIGLESRGDLEMFLSPRIPARDPVGGSQIVM